MARFDIMEAVITLIVTRPIIIVDNAFISGLTPRRTDEKFLIGSVVADGPVTNDAMTRSSSDNVKASSHPEITAGAIIGSVTLRKASQ
jgi:hypothetical protein